MLRTQACISFMLLLALRSSEGFALTQQRPGFATATTTTSSTKHHQQQLSSFKRHIPTSASSSSTTTAASLYSAQFQDSNGVNNRHAAKDYWYNIKTLPSSSILRDIKNPVLAVFGWSTAVSMVHFLLHKSGSSFLQSLAANMCISSSAHSFLVSALGLLLVFRTNSAYQRFYEGRKIWEQILSVSRNLSRLTSLYGRDIGAPRKHRLRNLIAAYPYLLRHHIRRGCLCEGDTVDPDHRLLLKEPSMQMVETRHEGDKRCGGATSPEVRTNAPPKQCWVDRRNLPWSLLTKGAVEKVARARNRPLWICDRLGREICDIPYGHNFSNRERQHFMSQVEKLTNAIGQCERIHQTAVPLNYARHSLRSLTLWLFTLPFCLVKDLGFMAGPAAAVIAWLMFGVYEIGSSIEDPFQGSLRLSILCDAIRNDVMGNDDDDDDDDDDWAEEESRNSAYTMEPAAWMVNDVAAQRTLETQILDAANLASQNPTPLISMADYEEIEK